ncbi:Histone deacetylase-like amidohydrolase [Planctopirus ephydatiae]|uniref:Histone deacetylase-like amidohydrolase n=1 Tax=Planctopirus ephydatiae TaxID=2528019 RepID=A0A518GIB3_9PLAN|nr:histone deacetylase [Planctopirus ephydatiae]QDV28322.1 Histone deacetylase-like amidohydrolase [Planctopirus ephydatiae]
MHIYTTERFVLPLPPGHRFPMSKYSALRERIDLALRSGEIDPCTIELLEPPAATDAQILLAHNADYLYKVSAGEMTRDDIKRLGFPWSPELIERSRRSSGATIEAARSALVHGFGANLAGGTHHAYADRAEGFCIFNDSVIAARVLQKEQLVQRVLIVDGDVHQGNGTAAITRQDPSIFTFSIHSERNYPFVKETSDLDCGLPDETGDDAYLAALDEGLAACARRFPQPDLVLFLAGADPFEGDKMGRLALTKAGLRARDRLVYRFCEQYDLPVAISMAGGYSPRVEDIVEIHFATVLEGICWNLQRRDRR